MDFHYFKQTFWTNCIESLREVSGFVIFSLQWEFEICFIRAKAIRKNWVRNGIRFLKYYIYLKLVNSQVYAALHSRSEVFKKKYLRSVNPIFFFKIHLYLFGFIWTFACMRELFNLQSLKMLTHSLTKKTLLLYGHNKRTNNNFRIKHSVNPDWF